MNLLKLLTGIILITLNTNISSAQNAGVLDSSFNGNGKYNFDFGFQDNINDVKIQPADQKIVVVGTAITPAFAGKLLVVRLMPDGSPDLSFSGTGSVIIPDFNESYAYECFIKSDGKIIVAGASADPNYVFSMLVIRFNEDGTIDQSFGVNGFAQINSTTGDAFAYAAVEQADHKILLAGTTQDANFRNVPTIVRLLENGTIDATFGINGVSKIPVIETDNEFTSMLVQTDGKIVASGHFDQGLTPGGQYDFDVLVARFDSTGNADVTFGTNGITLASASITNIDDSFGVQQTSTGNYVVAGFTTKPDFSYDALVMQFDNTGSIDLAFGNNGYVVFDNADQDVANDLKIQPDGKILVCGASGGFFFDPRDILVLRYNSNGTLDNSFGLNGVVYTNCMGYFDDGNAITLQQDGKIVVAGKANNGAQNDIAVVRYHNDLFSSINELSDINSISISPNPTSTNNFISIKIDLNASENIAVNLFDAIGKNVKTELINFHNSGSNTLNYFIPENLNSGIYSLQIVSEKTNFSAAKIVITK